MKTHSRKLSKSPTCFAVVKIRRSKARKPSYTLCGGLNPIYEHPQASNTVCCDENALYKVLQASYTICGVQNALSDPLQATYRITVVKTLSPKL